MLDGMKTIACPVCGVGLHPADERRICSDACQAQAAAITRGFCVCGADLWKQPDGSWVGQHRPWYGTAEPRPG